MSIISNMWKTIGGGDVGGPIHDLWDDFTGAKQAHDANETSINLANTAVQRRKADLQAAGFNPLLAVGQPADTPGIRQLPSLGSGIQSAVEAYKTYGASQVQKAQVGNLNSASASLQAKARLDQAEAERVERTNKGGGPELGLKETQARIEKLTQEANLSREQQAQVQAVVMEIAERIKTAPYERAKLYQGAWLDMMKAKVEALTGKAKAVAYEVLIHTAVNEIERAHKEYSAIEGPAGTTGANIRESSVGGGAGAAALIRSIFH